MSDTDIVDALEAVRAGNDDVDIVSDLELYLVDMLLAEGLTAVGARLMNLEGMTITLVDAPQDAPTMTFRTDHPDNALTIMIYQVDDLASASIHPDDAEVPAPEYPAGHQWFYATWERLIDAHTTDADDLEEPERTVYLIAAFEADLMNGGVGQFLSNVGGAQADETIKALRSVGATKTAASLKKAVSLRRKNESWDDLWERASRELEKLDDKLMADDEYLAMLTAEHFHED